MKKIFLMAAAAATLLASCAKEENPNNVDNGAEAKMDVVISFPKTMTRAADGNASALDVAVNTIDVFVFNADGTAATGNDVVNIDDFTTGSNNTYTLKPESRITTTAGTKTIYVGINLPAALAGATSESTLKNAADVTGLSTASGVAMLSAPKSQNLQAQEEDTTPTVNANVVPVTVERLVAKIAVTAGSESGYTPSSASFTVAPDKFAVGNLATSFYPVQRMENNKLVTPTTDDNTVQGLKAINTNGTAAKSLTDYFYVPEYRPAITNLRSDATYAVVRGSFTFTKYSTVSDGSIAVGDAPALAAGDDVYVVRAGANTYFCESNDIALNVLDAADGEGYIDVYEVADDNNLYTYYYVFINAADGVTDPLAVYRNQFINLTVNDVKGLGVPGDPTNPDTPPTTPPGGGETVIETEAYLEVEVDVKVWDYSALAVDLE